MQLKQISAQHLQSPKNHCNDNTENDGTKHHTLAQPHLFWTVLAEQERDDNPGKYHNPHQQKYENSLAELLAAHPFDTEIQLGRNIRT